MLMKCSCHNSIKLPIKCHDRNAWDRRHFGTGSTVKMPKLTSEQRHNAIGRLQAGSTQETVANYFGVSRQTISNLWRRYNATQSVEDRARSGLPESRPSPRTATYGYGICVTELSVQLQQPHKYQGCGESRIRPCGIGYVRQDLLPEDRSDVTD